MAYTNRHGAIKASVVSIKNIYIIALYAVKN